MVKTGGCRVEKDAEKADGAKRGRRMMESRHQPSAAHPSLILTHISELGLV
jgi:hypothetical protein